MRYYYEICLSSRQLCSLTHLLSHWEDQTKNLCAYKFLVTIFYVACVHVQEKDQTFEICRQDFVHHQCWDQRVLSMTWIYNLFIAKSYESLRDNILHPSLCFLVQFTAQKGGIEFPIMRLLSGWTYAFTPVMAGARVSYCPWRGTYVPER